jgi:Flp pilus assembly protein TadG
MIENPLNSNKTEIAQSMVEFAVSAIVLLLLLVAIADFGRAFFTYLSLRDAAQEGAAYASICPVHEEGIETRVRSASKAPVDLSSEHAQSDIEVTCRYIYDVDESGVIDDSDDFPHCSDGYSLDPDVYSPVPGHGVRISVVYPNFVITTPLLGSIIGQSITLRTEVTDTILLPASDPDEPCP